MKRYKARDIWHAQEDAVWLLAEDNQAIELEFDDGEVIQTTPRITIYSYYLGEFHRHYPKTPLLSRHHLGDRQVSKGTELDILGIARKDCRDAYGGEIDDETLSELSYDAVNLLYNKLVTRLKSYVSTITILDFIEVVDHPEIKEANESAKPNRLSIDQTYDKVWSVLTREGELKENTVARMAKAGLVSKGQILQCVSSPGFKTDIDSNIFKRPILSGYTHGMRTLHDSMVESRSASKALVFSGDYVAESEYFSRELQLMSSIVTRLHPGDCGSTDYVLFKVRSGDLRRIAGKYYILEDGSLGEIGENDRHLVGKIVQMRSPLKCQHPDAYGVCETCYGALAQAIPHHTNLGHVAVTVTSEKISQNLLSTKHLDSSSTASDFDISEYDRKFIRTGDSISVQSSVDGAEIESNTVIKLAERWQGKPIRLALAETQAKNLPDIDYQDIDQLAPSNVTSLTEVNFIVKDGEFEEAVTVPVSMGNRHSWLTSEALAYIKKKGWRLTERGPHSERGSYEIDLSDWDVNQPLFQLPFKNADMVQYLHTVRSFIRGTGGTGKKKTMKTVRDFTSPDRALIEFYNLISSKLFVNIAHLEIIVLSLMARDVQAGDHRLPRPISEGQISGYRQNMEMRSFGASMAYQTHHKRLTDVRSFTVTTRPDSPFDNLLMPYPHANPTE